MVVRSPLHHQLAAFSPLPFTAIARGIGAMRDGRARLAAVLAREYDAHAVTLTDSGTSALQLAIRSAMPNAAHDGPVPRQRVVALPGFTCFEVATAALGAGVAIALYDVDPDTLAPDLASVERALRAGASAVVVSPLYGVPVDWTPCATLIHSYHAAVIEDAAQGHGARWRGRPLGALGDLSILSFGRGKGWTAGGGGALLHRRSAPGAPLEELSPADGPASALAMAAAQWALGRPSLYGLPARMPALGLGRTVYHTPHAPTAMSDVTAALVLQTQAHAAREAAVRRTNGERWQLELAPIRGLDSVRTPAGALPGHLRFPLRVRRGMASFGDADAARRLGIAPTYPSPLAELTAVRDRRVDPLAPLPGAVTLARELITLPTHSRVTGEERSAILALCAEVARRERVTRSR